MCTEKSCLLNSCLLEASIKSPLSGGNKYSVYTFLYTLVELPYYVYSVTTSHLRDFGSARTAFSGFNQIGREEYYYRSADLFNLNDWIDEANALRTFRLRCYQAGNLEAIYIRVMYEFFVLHLLDEGREKICLAGERGLLWAKYVDGMLNLAFSVDARGFVHNYPSFIIEPVFVVSLDGSRTRSTGAIDSSQFQAYLDKIRENYIRLMEDNSRDKMDPVINRNDGGTKKREEEAGMNMLRRRRERLMRHLRRRRQKKQFKSEEEESFTSSSDSDEEMNISLAEVKRLMENMISTLKSKEEEETPETREVFRAAQVQTTRLLLPNRVPSSPAAIGRRVDEHDFDFDIAIASTRFSSSTKCRLFTTRDLNVFLKLECVVIATRLFRDVYRWCFRTEVVLFFPGFASFRWLAVRFASPISFTFPCLACNVNVNCKLEEIVMN
ncbi:hypothetical protein HID58_015126 [Brassica napus]|uniref:At2g35280-like TPR domain-containing protein n=1 Tax=Brassica napus TaxID=3708 RepID=A0ABQ8DJ42_BRANA|nr:hypothetical protein HID58_015126 [Brassica napus]